MDKFPAPQSREPILWSRYVIPDLSRDAKGPLSVSPTCALGRGRTCWAEIAEIAFHLFAEKGFEQTTAAAAAQAAGISRASFFRYFGSKEEAVFAAQEAIGVEIAEAVAARPEARGESRPPCTAPSSASLESYLGELGSRRFALCPISPARPRLCGRTSWSGS